MISSRTESGRPRVVILGGGLAGLVTAWELSSGDWRQRLDSITVYQRGWRLGGKGASSRGPYERIEEHGLHVLLGCFDATFRVLREVYGELDRPVTDPTCPIRIWRDAVAPAGDVGLGDQDGDDLTHFVMRFSGNSTLPGEPGAEDRQLTPLDVASRALQLLADFQQAVAVPRARTGIFLSTSPVPRPSTSDVGPLIRGAGLTVVAALLEGIGRASRLAAGDTVDAPALEPLADVIQSWRDGMRAIVRKDRALRRTWQLVDLVASSLQGMAVDGLLSGNGWDSIDHLDYGEWLAKHGAAPETLESPIVRAMHDLTFAYEGGDHTKPGFAAGRGLQLAGRMLFDFKGSIFWRMQAGTGETIFAPMYQALARRGVEFRFFRRLDQLGLSHENSIRTIELTRQAELTAGRKGYEPLVRVGGLPCWPHRPLADQLASDPGDDTESHRGARDGTGAETLVAGRDFDVAVLAVSLGMVPFVASELMARDPAWRAMVDEIGTVATRSAQLWFISSEADLGWEGPSGVTLSGFGGTFDTRASMSHLLAREAWPSDGAPRSLAYLCSAVPDTDPATGEKVVRDTLTRFLEREAGSLWPGTSGPSGFTWDKLWDDQGRVGPHRLSGQYVRANLDPSDRYVQSLPGSGRYRLAPGQTGFDNLVVAGDWTACGFDAGCVESATRSGILAARAILSGSSGSSADPWRLE
jgi:uncharacterized protein with NAD-binding domain and iron-sulfur cluster